MAHRLYQRFESSLTRFETKRRHPDDEPIYLGSASVLIVGMGRVGWRAYDFLAARKQRCVGLDSDPGALEKHLREGRRVLYADAEDPGLWQNLHIDNIKAVLLAMPDLEANTIAVTQLRRRGFQGLISATGVYPEHVDAIVKAGADTAYNYFDEVGVGFAEHVWEQMHPAAVD
jgi:Trk K+ transport system NAD-binding subunit